MSTTIDEVTKEFSAYATKVVHIKKYIGDSGIYRHSSKSTEAYTTILRNIRLVEKLICNLEVYGKGIADMDIPEYRVVLETCQKHMDIIEAAFIDLVGILPHESLKTIYKIEHDALTNEVERLQRQVTAAKKAQIECELRWWKRGAVFEEPATTTI